MKRHGAALRLRIYIGQSDQWRGKNLYVGIVQEARKRGLAGATVARGIMGYGAHSTIHEPHLLLTGDLPVLVEIVDSAEKIHAFLPLLDEMVWEGMVTLSNVEMITYTPER